MNNVTGTFQRVQLALQHWQPLIAAGFHIFIQLFDTAFLGGLFTLHGCDLIADTMR